MNQSPRSFATIAIAVFGVMTGTASLALANAANLSGESAPTTAPVLTQLQLRDRTVTITATSAGSRFSVLNESGQLLHAELTETELSQQYPDLFQQLRPAIAENETANDGSTLMMLNPPVNP